MTEAMGKNGRHLFTSESVTEGHPDKIADQISDAVLDALLAQDPMSRVACETMVTTGLAFIAGEITTKAYADLPGHRPRDDQGRRLHPRQVRLRLRDLRGHLRHPRAVARTSPWASIPGGAGDQGLMFGYACNETEELMPLPIMLAHKLTRRLSQVRKDEILDYLRPGREEPGHGRVRRRHGRCAWRRSSSPPSTRSLVKIETIREDILEKVIHAVIPPSLLDSKTKYFINPTGRFVVGGPQGDCGLTGRKIIVDTYGGVGSHGGGAFSGKDPTKVDRSASYMARHIAKNIVAAGLADRVEVQIAYAIGVAEPVSVMVDTVGHRARSRRTKIVDAIREIFPLTPKGIIEYLNLRRPIYKKTAAYGHFGRNEPEFTWERTDKADALRGLRPSARRTAPLKTQAGRRRWAARWPGAPCRPSGALRVALLAAVAVEGAAPRRRLHAGRAASSTSTPRSPTAAARPRRSRPPPSAAGLGFVVITDHNNLDAKPLEGYHDGVLVIVGHRALDHRRAPPRPRHPRSRLPLLRRRADALDDVRDLGGVAFAAHPLSPRADFRWTGWDLPGPWGIELLNGDSQWRAAGWPRLAAHGRALRR